MMFIKKPKEKISDEKKFGFLLEKNEIYLLGNFCKKPGVFRYLGLKPGTNGYCDAHFVFENVIESEWVEIMICCYDDICVRKIREIDNADCQEYFKKFYCLNRFNILFNKIKECEIADIFIQADLLIRAVEKYDKEIFKKIKKELKNVTFSFDVNAKKMKNLKKIYLEVLMNKEWEYL